VHGDPTGRCLLVANYVEGNVVVFPVREDGTPGEPSAVVDHSGSGPDKSRQDGPHPHSILASPDGQHAYAADLGTDTIHGYQFDPRAGSLKTSNTASRKLQPGTGPRHLLFHPTAPLLLVVLELSSEIAVLRRSSSEGSLEQVGCWSTLPPGDTTANHPSELVLTTDARFLYVANRGHDSIAIFSVDSESGTLELMSTTPCGGVTPRHIALSPDQEFLIVANQGSDGVVGFRRDENSGYLEPPGQPLAIPTPCFICF
jgi:6-phosphogluconolactonase